MSWFIFASTLVLFAVGNMCLPMSAPVTDLMSSKMPKEPATSLLSPENKNGPVAEWAPTDNEPSTSTDDSERKLPIMLFVINVLAIKNNSAEDSIDVLHSDVIEEVPKDIAVPSALFVLIIEDEDENYPVSLDDIARDLEKEGITVEKVVKDAKTRLVKVDLDVVEKMVQIPEGSNDFNKLIEHETKTQNTDTLTSVRRKRHSCLHCELQKLKRKKHHKYRGGYGRCNRCGGGQRTVYLQPVYRTVVYQPVYQYPVQQTHYPQHQGCNTCSSGGGGGYTYSQAAASASSASYGYGR